jgi:hypothetical protein
VKILRIIGPAVLLVMLLTGFVAGKQTSPYTPKVGSKERAAVLDTLRKPVAREIRQKVVFYDVIVRAKNGWAYVFAMPRDRKGKVFKKFGPDMDPGVMALLRNKAGRWQVLVWGLATDAAPLYEARKKYPQAPRSIFPSLPNDFPGDGPEGGSGFNNKD